MARDGMGRYDEAVDNISAYEALTDTIEHEAKAQQLAVSAPSWRRTKKPAKQQAKLQESAEAETEGMGSRSEKEGKAAERRHGFPDRASAHHRCPGHQERYSSTLFGK